MHNHTNRATGAFIHTFEPVHVYVTNCPESGRAGRNVLARALENPSEFPSPYWHLIERVDMPSDADWRLLDVDLNAFEDNEAEFRACLAAFDHSPTPWLFVDHRDAQSPFVAPDGALVLKPNASITNCGRAPSVATIPYWEMVDDFLWYENAKHDPIMDVSFVGEWTPFRAELTAQLKTLLPLLDLVIRDRFFHGSILSAAASNHGQPLLPEDSRIAWRERYIASARNARFVLCPMGYGPLSFRFYEAMSFGRPPILVSGPCELPFADSVNYESFCFRVDADQPDAAKQVSALIREVNKDEWAQMADRARAAFDTHLSIRAMPLHLYWLLRSATSAPDDTRE
jgi:hypothetical protein